MKLRVPFELISSINEVRRQINQLEFKDIEWTKDGKPIPLSEEEIKDWSFIGLNNTDFPNTYEIIPEEVK